MGHFMCPFGGCTTPRQTSQWTPYYAEPFFVTQMDTRKPNLRQRARGEHARSDAVQARCAICIFPFFHVPATLGSNACNLLWHPKWRPSVKWKVNGAKCNGIELQHTRTWTM